MLQRALESAGHSVEHVDNGDRALVSFRRRRPDLVITDIVMPGLTSPIIAISGGGRTATFEFLDLARDVGAWDVLRKPVSSGQLLAAVDRCPELRTE